MATCPNINLPEWKELVAAQGKARAYFLWNEYSGDVPGQEYTGVAGVESISPKVFGTRKPKYGSFTKVVLLILPSRIVWIIDLVTGSEILFAPDWAVAPTHPVLTINAGTEWLFIFSLKSSAYLNGCKVRNGPPKQGEKVAVGFLIPLSVPATLAV